VDEDDERLGVFRLEARLLAQLAEGGVLRLLPRLDLPAGKLPRAAQVLVVGPSRDQDRAVAQHDRQGDVGGQAVYS
jgi:hypothetical protein